MVTKDKKEIPVEIGLTMLIFDNKKWILAIMRDITERKKAFIEKEKLILELEEANEKLKELSKMKDDFLSIASHDLRSPFMCILAYVDLLNKSNLDKNQAFYVEMIKRSAKTQLEYINDLLDIIKLESGNIKLKIEKHNIKHIIEESFNNHKVFAAQKNINLILDISQDIDICINFDKAKILQVLNNLITNAIKFTKHGGKIIVKSFRNKDKIETHIIDNGVGISLDRIEEIFSQYKNNHTDGTDGEPGTGLGLAICKNFILLHNGEINVMSKINEGSDFYFTLPITN